MIWNHTVLWSVHFALGGIMIDIMCVVPVLFAQHQVQAGTFQTQSNLPLEAPAWIQRDRLIRHAVLFTLTDRKLWMWEGVGGDKLSYHGLRDLRHNAPLDPPTSGIERRTVVSTVHFCKIFDLFCLNKVTKNMSSSSEVSASNKPLHNLGF